MQRIRILAAVLGLLFTPAVWSQQDGGTGGGVTGGGGRSTGTLPTTGGQQGRTNDPYRWRRQQQRDPQLGSRSIFDNPNVGRIVLRRLDGVEGMPISFTSLSAPKKARKAYDKAFRETQKREPNLQRAEKELETAVGLHPQYAAAWNMLGRV